VTKIAEQLSKFRTFLFLFQKIPKNIYIYIRGKRVYMKNYFDMDQHYFYLNKINNKIFGGLLRVRK